MTKEVEPDAVEPGSLGSSVQRAARVGNLSKDEAIGTCWKGIQDLDCSERKRYRPKFSTFRSAACSTGNDEEGAAFPIDVRSGKSTEFASSQAGLPDKLDDFSPWGTEATTAMLWKRRFGLVERFQESLYLFFLQCGDGKVILGKWFMFRPGIRGGKVVSAIYLAPFTKSCEGGHHAVDCGRACRPPTAHWPTYLVGAEPLHVCPSDCRYDPVNSEVR